MRIMELKDEDSTKLLIYIIIVFSLSTIHIIEIIVFLLHKYKYIQKESFSLICLFNSINYINDMGLFQESDDLTKTYLFL